MGYEEVLEELRKAVAEAGEEIRRKHRRADVEEAKELLRRAAIALEKDRPDEALELARRARLAALGERRKPPRR